MKLATQSQTLRQIISDTYGFFPQLTPKLVWLLISMVLTNFLIIIPSVIGGISLFSTGQTAIGASFFVIAYIAIMLLNSFWAGALTTRAQGVMAEDNPLVETTWSNAKSKIGRVFCLWICLFIFILALMLISTGIVMLANFIGGSVTSVIVMVPVIIALLYYIFRFASFIFPTLILEGTGVIAAFGRSYALTSGMVWRIIITLLCANIPGWLLQFLAKALLELIGTGYSIVILVILFQLLAALLNAILGISASLVLFNHARLRQSR